MRALRGELCAGMMLTLPVSSSTTCTWPGDRPGNASNFDPRQTRPSGLSAVSNTESFLGGEEKAQTWMLFCNAMTIRDLDSRTRNIDVRASSVMTAFCLASSQMISYSSVQYSICILQGKGGSALCSVEIWVVFLRQRLPYNLTDQASRLYRCQH